MEVIQSIDQMKAFFACGASRPGHFTFLKQHFYPNCGTMKIKYYLLSTYKILDKNCIIKKTGKSQRGTFIDFRPGIK